jgi:hypothetical protein
MKRLPHQTVDIRRTGLFGDLVVLESRMAKSFARCPLDEVAALEPTCVVAGHKKVANGDDPKIIGESQQFVRDFSRFADQATTPADIVTGMLEIYPDWDDLRTPWYSAKAAIDRKGSERSQWTTERLAEHANRPNGLWPLHRMLTPGR